MALLRSFVSILIYGNRTQSYMCERIDKVSWSGACFHSYWTSSWESNNVVEYDAASTQIPKSQQPESQLPRASAPPALTGRHPKSNLALDCRPSRRVPVDVYLNKLTHVWRGYPTTDVMQDLDVWDGVQVHEYPRLVMLFETRPTCCRKVVQPAVRHQNLHMTCFELGTCSEILVVLQWRSGATVHYG